MRQLGQHLAVSLLIAGAAGCASPPVGAGYDDNRSAFGEPLPREAEALQVAVASYADVLDSLGPPTAITTLSDGFAFLYESGQLRTEGVGLSVASLRLGYAWSSSELALAAFVFDARGLLIGAAVDRSVDDTGDGFAFGPQKAEAADDAAYLLPSPQHRWGSQLLRRLPVLLNAQSDLDSGGRGLGLRGTTSKVGQRTLASGYITAQDLLQLLKAQAGQ